MRRGNGIWKKHKVAACILAAVLFVGELLQPVCFLRAEEEASSGIEISVITIDTVEGSASGDDLETALENLETETGIQISGIKELVITGGKIREADWTFLFENTGSASTPGFNSLTDFRAEGSGRGEGVIPNGDGENGKYFPRSVERVEIPDGVTSIGAQAFYNAWKLEELTIPGSVKSIGIGAFYSCGALAEVNLSEGLEEIGQSAFWKCSNLEQIRLPDSVTMIGGTAFYQCTALKEVTLSQNLTTIKQSAFYECENLQRITIPDHVTTIEEGVFMNCSALREVVFPDSLESIGMEGEEAGKHNGAFGNCISLTKVVIPGSVKGIGSQTFSGCTSLEEVVLEDGVETIRASAFNSVPITNIIIPGSVKEMGASAFGGCQKLEKVILSEGVTKIGPSVFFNCSNLTEVSIPASVTLLGNGAFQDCTSLSVLNLYVKNERAVTSIEKEGEVYGFEYEDPFLRCPTPRRMYFYTEEGLPLSESTVPTFSDAAAAYRMATDHDLTDELWWGWQMERAFSVVSHLTNLTGSNETVAWREIDGDYATTLVPAASAEGVLYTLPEDIVVKIGDRTASPGTDYTYDSTAGTLLIKAASINGNIEIEAAADESVQAPASPTPDPPATPSPEPPASPTPDPTATPSPAPPASPTPDPPATPSPAPPASPTPDPTVTPSPVPPASPTPDPTVTPSPAPPASPTPDPAVTPSPMPPATPTPVPDKDVSDIADGLGVSEETAQKIQVVAEELDVSKDTILVTDSTITSQKTDSDIKGAYFARIQARASQITENNIKLVWNKVKGADGYRVYGNRCNTKKIIHEYKLVKTITNKNKRSYIQRKCAKGSYYKFIVRAYKIIDGKKVTIAVSKTIHVVTTGGKNGNARSVKTNKNKLSLKKGKTFRLKAKEVKPKKKLRYHRKVCYESSDPKVASVSKKGIIKGKKKGSCIVYAYAQSGIYKKVKVTVS